MFGKHKSIEVTAPETLEDVLVQTGRNIYHKGQRMPKIFLAGGITNCPKWQIQLLDKLKNQPAIFYNPRRPEGFEPFKTGEHARKQIEWEHERILDSDFVVFWFARGSDNPIVLFEYGKQIARDPDSIILGIDPEYPRAFDVREQTALEMTPFDTAGTMEGLAYDTKRRIKQWYK